MVNKLTLHDGLKLSYESNKKAKKELLKHGYYLDKKLSKGNEKVYYSPTEKKLVMSIAGSNSLTDWIYNDPMLLIGKLKSNDTIIEIVL